MNTNDVTDFQSTTTTTLTVSPFDSNGSTPLMYVVTAAGAALLIIICYLFYGIHRRGGSFKSSVVKSRAKRDHVVDASSASGPDLSDRFTTTIELNPSNEGAILNGNTLESFRRKEGNDTVLQRGRVSTVDTQSSRNSQGTTKSAGESPHDNDNQSALLRAAGFGQFWLSECWIWEEMMGEWSSSFIYDLRRMREGVTACDECQCQDPECGWNGRQQSTVLYPHQTVHAILNHFEGTLK